MTTGTFPIESREQREKTDSAFALTTYGTAKLAELRRIPTRALHSSGITIDPNGNIWIGSTFTYEVICFSAADGRELCAYPTPPYDKSGSGVP